MADNEHWGKAGESAFFGQLSACDKANGLVAVAFTEGQARGNAIVRGNGKIRIGCFHRINICGGKIVDKPGNFLKNIAG